MSKSVDETVVDFFRLLLTESPSPEKDTEPVQDTASVKQASAAPGQNEPNEHSSEPLQSKAAPQVHIRGITQHAHIDVPGKTAAQQQVTTAAAKAMHAASVSEKGGVKPQASFDANAEVSASNSAETPASATVEPLIAPPYSGEPERLREQQRSSQRLQLEALAQAKPAEPLDKAALEKLLAPVFEVSREVQTVAAPKVDVSTVAAELPKAAVKPVPAPAPNPVEIRPVAAAVSNAQVTKPVAAAEVVSATAPQTQTGATPPSITKDLQEQLDDEFQVLFFKVAGLTLAVPLVSLGGIVRVERINHIFGRPSWFLGVQTHRDAQLNLVDTCAWVMPEKYDEKLAQSVNYQYLVLLEDSNWGLACESLVNAVRIKQSEVNWRTSAGKRPWLAGVVKEQMCGILNVTALIQLLDAGLGCQDPIN